MWQRKRIFIWAKTRPELSRLHKETVCTGGVFEDTRQFVRLYPIPLRFLDDEKVFKKYQWIEADVRKAIKDARPESYNIRCDTIETAETIPTERGDWSRRAEWIVQPPGHIFRSVEALQATRRERGVSIGMVKPLAVTGCHAEPYSPKEKGEFWAKYRGILAEQELPFPQDEDRVIRALPPPVYRFRVQFRCDDPACQKDHTFTVFDWEVDALYNNLVRGGDAPATARDKVVAKVREETNMEEKDLYLFLGNIAAHPQNFTIVGLWHPKKQKPKEQPGQLGLFDGVAAG